MSTQFSSDSSDASNSNFAPTPSSDTSPSSPDSHESAPEAHAPSNEVAASGDVKSIDQLDADYKQSKQNILASEDREVEAEPEKSQPEPEKVEAKTEPEVVEELATEDDLVERTEPRTVDEFKKLFPRSEPKAREELAKIEAAQFALQKEIDSVGGTDGLEIAKGIIPALLSANPTAEESDNVFQTVTETNPALMQAMSWNILTHSLKEERPDPATGLPINIVTGNAIVKEFLNENYDVEKIEKLIAYDEAGLLDQEELDKELETFTGKSKREQELEARLKAVEDKDKQAEAAEKTNAEARVAQHIDKTEKYVVQGAMSQIILIAEQYGWTATKEELASSDPAVKAQAEFKVAFGEFLTPWLDSFLRNHVKWGGVESIGKREEAFNVDGNPTRLMKTNGGELISAAVAAFKGKVRVMNTAFAKAAGTTRNAQLKTKTTTRSGAVENSEIPPVKKPSENGNRSPHDEIAAADEAYRRSVRDSRASL